MEEMMTIEEIAEFLRLKPSTVYKKTCRRQIPYIKIGGCLRFEPSRIKEWLESQRVAPLTETIIGERR